MHTRPTSLWSLRLFAFLAIASSTVAATGESAFQKAAPDSPTDLRAMEQQITSVVKKVIPATVALQVGGAQASGVIVSADGYVLTAAHVIERPGRSARVIFADGRTVKGKTLGLNPQVD